MISVVCLIFTLAITQMARSEFTTFWMMILFSIVYTPYLVLMATMGTYQIYYIHRCISLTYLTGLYGHARQIIGYSKWNATSRK